MRKRPSVSEAAPWVRSINGDPRPIYSPTISNPLCFTCNLGSYLGKDGSHLLPPRKGELGRWIQCCRNPLFYLEGSTIIVIQRQKVTAFVLTMFVSAAYWVFRWDSENSHATLLCKEVRLCILPIRFFLQLFSKFAVFVPLENVSMTV